MKHKLIEIYERYCPLKQDHVFTIESAEIGSYYCVLI